jgi:glycosyltransferase involved in cell wall biosynthesis
VGLLRGSRRGAPTYDVAIYAPFAALFYGPQQPQSGGAELQTTLLARELAKHGLRVAHVVYQLEDPLPLEPPAPALVERADWQRHRLLGEIPETYAVWSALRKADAGAYVVRGGGGYLSAAAGFCRLNRRRLVFSSSSDLDFDWQRPDLHRVSMLAYRSSLRLADRIVVQTRHQLGLAQSALADVPSRVIPSFSQPAEQRTTEPEYFIWINRLVEYKLPERYLELAAALPDIPFKMVGARTSETPAELVERITEEARRLPNLELVSERPREQLLDEVGRAAAVVTTSLVEGMPNTFLEAWARGVPVLSLHVDPDGLIAEHGIGMLAGGATDRLTDAARRVWGDARLRQEMGARARAFVRDVHSPDAVAGKWVELLEELLPTAGAA